jgi:hypothetical protein
MTDFLPVDPHADTNWDAFVRSSPDGWVWGLAGWQRLIERIPEWNLRPLSFEIRENGRRVAIMPLHLNLAGVAASGGWGLIGPILAPELTGARLRSVRKATVGHATIMSRNVGAGTLSVGSPALTGTSLTNKRGVNPFFEIGFDDRSTYTVVLDLTQTEDELWAGLSANARQEIRKALNQGWRVEEVDWKRNLRSYYEVHAENYHRTGVQPHPFAYFEGIAEEMAPSGHSRLWAGYPRRGKVAAYHNNATYGYTCLYHTGCSTGAALGSGINYLLMWNAIKGAKARAETLFEVGEVFPNIPTGKQAGLTIFKSKFGGELCRSYKAQKTLVAAHSTEKQPCETRPIEELSPRAEGILDWLRGVGVRLKR